MKNREFENNHSMLNEESEWAVKELRDGLEKLDEWHPVTTPNLQWFQQQVASEKKRIRKMQWKALFSFIFVAVLVLSVVIAVVYHQPILFLYFQLAGIILLPFVLNRTRKKVSNE